jgi:hypothetical protein
VILRIVWDVEVAKSRILNAREYAEEQGIEILDVFWQPGLNDFLVRASFPRGTFAAFRREFGGICIKRA